VTTDHDLVPFRLPTLVPARHRWAVRCLLGGALRRAHRVIAVSETTRGELLARYRLPPERVVVVPEAAAPHFVPPSPSALSATRARYGLSRPYVLFVGFLEPKKNLGVLLEAVAALRRTGTWGDTELIVVGAPGWGPDPVQRATTLGLDGAVRFVGAVADAELPALYGGALAFAFPSLWEGFGLPALEAMAAGAPVASNRGALPEVTGSAALLVDPPPSRWRRRSSGSSDPALRERLRVAGLARAPSSPGSAPRARPSRSTGRRRHERRSGAPSGSHGARPGRPSARRRGSPR
jgi:glycosyltransferase involved in cell wall biosynthesis